ncbi:putative peptidoglycan lipid II flippase [Edaphobacter aggregans]|uniref:Putative peptidoglycan lipid II flippase n=1 Tax=Edaphobacter aggregans TaxID=570835 RepID=A0A3R9Q9M6_9BACT|nr:murein biosynthesis integral membrane protein MurJ [Edaphobacter aggregans]RSL16601.1 putative peptidoglycan lipid II flippase [Edaphobacter aggregans]
MTANDEPNPILEPLEAPAAPEPVKPRRNLLGFLHPSHRHTAASATILLTLSALLSRVIGLIRDQFIAYKFGAGHSTDAYNVAFYLPELINYLLVGGAASITFVTILERYRANNDEREGERALSIILNTMVLVLGTAIILGEIFTRYYIRLYFDPNSPEGILSTHITRILLPGQLFFFSGGVLTAVLLVRKQFTFQALTPLIYNVCIIAGGALLANRMGIASLGVGALAGAYLGAFLLNAYGAYRAGMRYQPILDLKHPGLREWVRLSLPLMLGVTVITLDSQILGYFAKHGAGDISRLTYAKRLFTAPMAIIGQAAGAASLPFFAALYGRNQFDAFRSAVNRSVSRLVAFSFLGSAVMIALARPAVDIVFRRGNFRAEDATATAAYFAIFAISLALWTAQAIYARAFYAAGETFIPMLAGTIITFITIPIYWTLHQHFNVIGLAWASDLAIILHTVTLATLLHRRRLVPLFGPSGGLDRPEIYRAAAAGLISFAGTTLLLHLFPQRQTYLGDIISLTMGGIVWSTLAIATLHLTGSKLLDQIRSRIS